MNKEYPKIIKLPNRYRENVYLEQVHDNIYKLELPDPYCRIGIDNDNPNEYTFVDPSGGPFISVGGELYDYQTRDVYKCEKIYWEKNENDELGTLYLKIEKS